MAHNCVDWTTTPPTRKTPLLILRRGDDRVYATVPIDLKTLQDAAKREFALGDVDVHISSSCVNLCDGRPVRITENTWEHVSAYIGCVTVDVAGARVDEGRAPREELPRAQDVADEHDAGAKEMQPMHVDEPDHRLGDGPSGSGREADREEEEAPSDRERNHDRPIMPENQREDPEDEEVSAFFPRKPRRQRHAVSEDEGEGDESEREPRISAKEAPDVASPLKKIKKEQTSDYRSEPEEPPAEQPGAFGRPNSPDQRSTDRPIKQEKHDGGNARSVSYSQPQSEPDRSQAPAESGGDALKLMIRVAHRPSKQESKFTTKSTTKVGKVLTGACKSFGLDPSWATMYLIVPMEDEDGHVENLFPCDKNDTIARAGAEREAESKFLLKMAGEE